MTIIVNNGSTLTVGGSGLTLTADGTVSLTGLLDGAGTITGGFTLANLGTISADAPGGGLDIRAGTLTNTGTILANNGTLTIESGVNATSLSGTTLTAGVWEAGGTGVLNFLPGLIATDNATITLNGTGSVFTDFDRDALTIQPIDNTLTRIGGSGVLNLLDGRSFTVSDSLVVDGVITLAGGTLSAPAGISLSSAARITGFGAINPGTPLVNDGTIDVLGGTLTLPAPGLVSGAGTLQAEAGTTLGLLAEGLAYAGSIVNHGTVAIMNSGIAGKLAITGTYSGSGGFLIAGGFDPTDLTILELPATVSADVAFDQNAGELLLDAPASFNGTVAGFNNTDTIIMIGVANAKNATLTGDVLTVKTNGGSILQSLKLDTGSINYNAATFAVSENISNNRATLTVSGATAAACYAAGTRIGTVTGETLVEQLAVGDMVRTHFAGLARVVWIGHRHVDCRRHPQPATVWPVRVDAHAFGPRSPHRDLWLSPDHAIFIDGVLIPVKHLINGRTICQVKLDQVTYFHVELAEHDILLAEGLPAESYLENGDRSAFDNGGPVVAAQPEFGPRRWEALGCAPFVVTGPRLDAVVAGLARRTADPRSTGRKRRHAA